jgi:hypothetical protein
MRIEVVFKEIFHANQNFKGGESCLFQIGLFGWVEETLVSLQRKPFMLDASASTTFFPCENWVCFQKEYSLWIIVFKVRKGCFSSNKPFQLSWRNTCISPKKTIYFRICSIYHIVPSENRISFWKEYVLQIRILKDEKGSFFPTMPIQLR